MTRPGNSARGEAALQVAGEAVLLRPSFEALVAAEQELGPLFALVERAAEGRLGLAEMVALFWHCAEGVVPRERLGRRDRRGRTGEGDAGAADPARADPAGAVSARFIDSAAMLAGLAGACLGWSPDDFWRATPAELASVLSALAGESGSAASADDLTRLMGIYPDG